MKVDKYKITTVTKGIKRRLIWDSSAPINVDHKLQWIIENTEKGIRVRYLGGKENELQKDSSISISESLITKPSYISLSKHSNENIQIKVQRLKTVPPAYLALSDQPIKPGEAKQIIIYAGNGLALSDSQPFHDAHVAYARGRPVFTIYRDAENYKIQPLLDGVRLKKKGQRSALGIEGEPWKLTQEELPTTTIIRGSRWWRFNWIYSELILNEIIDFRGTEAAQIRSILMNLTLLSSLFAILVALIWALPRQPKGTPEKEEAPVVKFVAPKTKMILIPTPGKVVQPELPKPTPQPEPKSEPKPEKPKTEKLKMANPTQVQINPAQAPPSDPKKASQAAAAQSVKALKEFLGGAIGLTTKNNIVAPERLGMNSKAQIFNNNSLPLGSTDIKPGYVPKSTHIGTIGGTDSGIDYSHGERATVGDQPAAFVAVESAGLTVQEGLIKEEVGEIIHTHMTDVRYCHESAMLFQPSLEGKLMIQFSIGSHGNVETAAVQSSTLTDHVLEVCLIKKLLTWKFPKPKGGIRVSVSYPFLFKTLGRE